MANLDYANYSINDFDRFDCLKLSKGLYFALAFVLRGYLIWLFSVANLSDHVSFLALVFPDKNVFYLNLFSGIPGLFVFALICLRRPNAPLWVKKCWRRSHYLLIIALLFDVLIMAYAYTAGYIHTLMWLIYQLLLISVFIVYIMKSKRLTINLFEFPEPFDEGSKK